jgi:hypothetical protein
MKKNMGLTDKTIRGTIAAIIAILYLMDIISGILALILGGVALAFLITSFISFCPLYLPFGINTRAKK